MKRILEGMATLPPLFFLLFYYPIPFIYFLPLYLSLSLSLSLSHSILLSLYPSLFFSLPSPPYPNSSSPLPFPFRFISVIVSKHDFKTPNDVFSLIPPNFYIIHTLLSMPYPFNLSYLCLSLSLSLPPSQSFFYTFALILLHI